MAMRCAALCVVGGDRCPPVPAPPAALCARTPARPTAASPRSLRTWAEEGERGREETGQKRMREGRSAERLAGVCRATLWRDEQRQVTGCSSDLLVGVHAGGQGVTRHCGALVAPNDSWAGVAHWRATSR